MIVKMNQKELLCHENSKKYKNWEACCIANDSYLTGFNDAIKLILSEHKDLEHSIQTLLSKTEDMEFKDGSHQLVFKDE